MKPRMIAVLVAIFMTFTATTTYAWGTTKGLEGPAKQSQGREKKERTRPQGDKADAEKAKAPIKKTDTKNLKDGTYTGSAEGYSGAVTVEVTVKDGKISGLKVLSHTETPGYYEKGAQVIERILKAGNLDVDTISGATLTSRAIIEATSKALEKAGGAPAKSSGSAAAAKPSSGGSTAAASVSGQSFAGKTLKDGVYTGSASAFNGPLSVQVTVAGGKITAAEIVSSNDDEPYLSQARRLLAAVVERQGTSGVDAVSGATFSSNGILNAVNNALAQAVEGGSVGQPVGGDHEALLAENRKLREENEKLKNVEVPMPEANAPLKDGQFEGKAQGYAGEIAVRVTVSGGKVSAAEVVAHHEDEPYFSQAKAVLEQIVAKGTGVGVETVSGATYSSRGLLNAVTRALHSAAGNDVPSLSSDDGLADKLRADVERLKKELEAKVAGSDVAVTGALKDGTFNGAARGYGGDVEVSVVVAGGKIKDIRIDQHKEDEPYFSQAKAVLSKIISNGSTDKVEAVSGATFSSKGILRAVNKALQASAGISGGSDDAQKEIADLKKAHEETMRNLDEEYDNLKRRLAETIEANADVGAMQDGTFVGEAKGYRPGIKVEITVKDGKVTATKLLAFNDDEEVNGKKYLGRAGAGQLLQAVMEKQSIVGVDVKSGATLSSQGVLNAALKAMKAAAGNGGTDDEKLKELQFKIDTQAREIEKMNKENAELKARIRELMENPPEDPMATEKHFEGESNDYPYFVEQKDEPIRVKVTLLGGEVQKIEVTEHSQTPDNQIYYRSARAVLKEIKANNSTEGVEMVSGATYTSWALLRAVNESLEKAQLAGAYKGTLAVLPDQPAMASGPSAETPTPAIPAPPAPTPPTPDAPASPPDEGVARDASAPSPPEPVPKPLNPDPLPPGEGPGPEMPALPAPTATDLSRPLRENTPDA